MAHRLTKVAAAAAAATALVAGGYAVGTRSDGSAEAARAGARATGPYGRRPDHDRARLLQALAGTLGVTEPALRNALEALRPQRRAARDEHVAELAKALGIGEAKVRAALDKLRAQRGGPAAHGGGPAPGAPPAPPDGGTRRGHRDGPWGRPDRGARISALARALGLQEADVRAALHKLAPARRDAAQQRRDAFATALAAKLGIDPARTRAALNDFAAQRPRGRWQRGHPPGSPRP